MKEYQVFLVSNVHKVNLTFYILGLLYRPMFRNCPLYEFNNPSDSSRKLTRIFDEVCMINDDSFLSKSFSDKFEHFIEVIESNFIIREVVPVWKTMTL